jgi:hypothetical protein
MSNFNTAIRYDSLATSNPDLKDYSKDFCDADNGEFFAEVARQLAKPAPGSTTLETDSVASIVLIGEYGLPGYRIRRAQEVLRIDRTPSFWSHAFLLLTPLAPDAAGNRDPHKSAILLESSLSPDPKHDLFSYTNGVSCRRLADYTDSQFTLSAAHSVPNVAVVSYGLKTEERASILERAKNPDSDQLGYDLLSQLASWYAYVASRGTVPNPLASGVGLFSTAYTQLAYDAAGIDLAPGAQQRNLAPEHIWQAARYLYPTFRATAPASSELVQRPVRGFYCVRDRACVVSPVDIALPRTIGELLNLEQPPRESATKRSDK